jgi:hypothetical protein
MAWVRERTIPTERPPLVGEVIANFWVLRVSRGQRDGSLRPYSRFSRQDPLLFYQVAPHLYSRGWVDSVREPLLFFWYCRESNPSLRICSQEFWPLDHRGGHNNKISLTEKRENGCEVKKPEGGLSAVRPYLARGRTSLDQPLVGQEAKDPDENPDCSGQGIAS